MTYNVFGGTLNLTQSINQSIKPCVRDVDWLCSKRKTSHISDSGCGLNLLAVRSFLDLGIKLRLGLKYESNSLWNILSHSELPNTPVDVGAFYLI